MSQDEVRQYLESMNFPELDRLNEPIPENPSFLWRLVNLDPALWRGAVIAVCSLLASLGVVVVSEEVQLAVIGLVMAVIALVQALWTKRSTVPVKKVVVYKPDPVGDPTKVAPGPAVSTDIPAVANAAADNGQSLTVLVPFPEKETEGENN